MREYNAAEEKHERWRRSFFTVDNKLKPLAFKARTAELKKGVTIYDKRKHCPRRVFLLVMTIADVFGDSLLYRALRFTVMRRGY